MLLYAQGSTVVSSHHEDDWRIPTPLCATTDDSHMYIESSEMVVEVHAIVDDIETFP